MQDLLACLCKGEECFSWTIENSKRLSSEKFIITMGGVPLIIDGVDKIVEEIKLTDDMDDGEEEEWNLSRAGNDPCEE